MKAPKIMMALIASVVVVVLLNLLLKVMGISGVGILTVFSLMLISLALLVVPIVGLVISKPDPIDSNLSIEEAALLQKERKKLRIAMLILGMGLSIMAMGVLFKVMHWPGAMFNLRVGQVIALTVAIITIILSWRSKYMMVKYLGFLAVAFSLVFGNAYLYGSLDKIYNREFKRYCEAVDARLQNDSYENWCKVNAENAKIGALNRDSERYNRLTALEDLAAQMAKGEEHGKVVCVLRDPSHEGFYGLSVFGAPQSRKSPQYQPEVSLSDYVENEVSEGDILYVVTDEESVKEHLVELGVDEKNIVMVGQE